MSAARLLHEVLPAAELSSRSGEWRREVLGVVGFEAAPPIDGAAWPAASCGTPQLDAAAESCEVWRAAGAGEPPIVARHGRLISCRAAGLAFGAISIDERELLRAGPDAEAAALRAATDLAYRSLFEALEGSDQPHLVRVWNYLPDINRSADGEERYRHFNAARRTAFERAGRAATASAPAATAVGSSPGGALAIQYLAAAQRPVMIENPRQISAYHYPPQYGRASPLFSRACLMHEAHAVHLFVSGTASIVGHRTVHPGDVEAQTREALSNIVVLLDEAGRMRTPGESEFGALDLKVYLRREADLEAVRRVIASHGPRARSVLYLRADICRADLLVEIEAYGCAQRA